VGVEGVRCLGMLSSRQSPGRNPYVMAAMHSMARRPTTDTQNTKAAARASEFFRRRADEESARAAANATTVASHILHGARLVALVK
jgi:hypothetical protein